LEFDHQSPEIQELYVIADYNELRAEFAASIEWLMNSSDIQLARRESVREAWELEQDRGKRCAIGVYAQGHHNLA